jgi:hypothetical protein
MIPDSARRGMSLSRTKRRGSRSPMICRNTRVGRRSNDRLRPGEGRSAAAAGYRPGKTLGHRPGARVPAASLLPAPSADGLWSRDGRSRSAGASGKGGTKIVRGIRGRIGGSRLFGGCPGIFFSRSEPLASGLRSPFPFVRRPGLPRLAHVCKNSMAVMKSNAEPSARDAGTAEVPAPRPRRVNDPLSSPSALPAAHRPRPGFFAARCRSAASINLPLQPRILSACSTIALFGCACGRTLSNSAMHSISLPGPRT